MDEAIPQCRRCKGTGVFEWSPGKSGPCFLCNGTGDGRIQNYAGFGPRKPGGRRKWNGNGAAGNGAAMLESGDDSGEAMPPAMIAAPVVTGQHMTATEHMAAALAAMQQSAPIDADMVRQILSDEFSAMGAVLSDTIALARDSHARLTAAIAGIPQRLEIVWNGTTHTLPAMRHCMTEKLLRIVKAGKRAYIVGPAGSGKTTAAKQVAESLGLRFYYQGAMSGSHAVIGHEGLNRYHTTPTREAWENGGLLLIDEIDGSEADALLAIHPIDNGMMTFPDSPIPVPKHPDFRLIVAANTYGKGADRIYVGRSQLDGATLNRFVFLDWQYDEALELAIAGDTKWTRHVQAARKAIDTLKIRHVVSPRNAIDGNDLLAAGFDWAEVEAMALWQGMADGDIARVRGAL